MCLAIPVKVIEKNGDIGIGEISGVKREIDLRFLDDVEVGDYVILHTGFAIQKLDEKSANEIFALFREIEEKANEDIT